jgi:hypothetical protein
MTETPQTLSCAFSVFSANEEAPNYLSCSVKTGTNPKVCLLSYKVSVESHIPEAM